MYKMFFQPFQAVDMMKKGGARAFALMMLVASALSSLAVLLMYSSAGPAWMKLAAKNPQWLSNLQWSSWKYAQYFIILLVAIYIATIIKSALIHLVMKIFSEKGTFLDSFKVMTSGSFLMSVYLLLAVIVAVIPEVGLGLAVIIFAIGVLITIAVSLKGLAVLYKTDIVTICIALGITAVAAVCAMQLGFFALISTRVFPTEGHMVDYDSIKLPRMMQLWGGWNQNQTQYPYQGTVTQPTAK